LILSPVALSIGVKEFLNIFGPVAVAIGVIWFAWWKYAEGFSADMAARGQLGDLFGGVNAIFSGLALAGVVTAVILQSKELQLQRGEMLLQREQLELQRKELELSREEFKRMAEANEQAAAALTRQLGLQIQAARIQGLSTLATIANDDFHQLDKNSPFAMVSTAPERAQKRENELIAAIQALEENVMMGSSSSKGQTASAQLDVLA